MGNGLGHSRLRTMAVIAARDAGLDSAHVDEVVEAVEGVLGSDLWQRSLQAKRRLFEVPFTITESVVVEGLRSAESESAAGDEMAMELPVGRHSSVESHHGEPGQQASEELLQKQSFDGRRDGTGALGDRTLVLQGVIDMMFEEDDGWVIVDFKTDYFEPEEEPEVVGRYADQVRAYASVWSEQFGQPVKEGGLYFTRSRKYVEVGL